MGAEESHQAEEDLKTECENQKKDQAKIKQLEQQLALARVNPQTDSKSRIGASAISKYDRSQWKVTRNVFTTQHTDHMTCLSYTYSEVVARMSLTIKEHVNGLFTVGIVTSNKINEALTKYFLHVEGGAGWELQPKFCCAMQSEKGIDTDEGCLPFKKGQRLVLEADGRVGKRTLKLSQDGVTQPTFFQNIPVPFRFAVHLLGENAAFEMESIEVVEEPQMVGGTVPLTMGETNTPKGRIRLYELNTMQEKRKKDQAKIKQLEKQLALAQAKTHSDPQSRKGASAISEYDRSQWEVTGRVFTAKYTGHLTCLSYKYGEVVVRMSLTIKEHVNGLFTVGIVTSNKINEALTKYFLHVEGGAGWELQPKFCCAMQSEKGIDTDEGCLPFKKGQRLVLEADGRVGWQTLKLSQDGVTQPTYFQNIPVPFRFAVHLLGENAAFEIESIEVVEKPQLVGGTVALTMG
ncbi:hypothetical protein BLNAU_14550 [Blattamonas nauphoetae]|uniref:Uncharacterized protein n=1 Tax=Blattamonas nauphoetae TaxID=2049346 RepID=A0ABQ9XDJ0_9EUKA|nr:hypothetical protein BLNAU_14550 [Blattamonas nauphoetae]